MGAKALTRIKISRNGNYKFNGTKSLISAYTKFNVKTTKPGPYQYAAAHQKLVKTNADGTTGEVTAEDQQNDSFYTCPVQIGTPAQTLQLDFDTGSSDLWVWSTKLPTDIQSAGTKNNVAIFDSTKSSTFADVAGSTWSITYGDGSSASGVVGTDNVTIGDITIKQQAVELANKLSSSFETEGDSGLLGLGWGSINTVKPTAVKTPVENMIAQDDIPAADSLFTAYLSSSKDASDPDDDESFYTFGSIDQSVIEKSGQQLAWTPVDNSQGFWMFDSASYTINGTTTTRSGGKAIADTGTTLLLTSDDVVEAIYAQITGSKYDSTQQGYLIPTPTAATTSSLPKITFAVGDVQFAVGQEQLAFSASSTSGMSFGAIQSRGSLTFDIFGDAFLVGVYAAFDVGNTRFGCVQRPAATSTTTTGSTAKAGKHHKHHEHHEHHEHHKEHEHHH